MLVDIIIFLASSLCYVFEPKQKKSIKHWPSFVLFDHLKVFVFQRKVTAKVYSSNTELCFFM